MILIIKITGVTLSILTDHLEQKTGSKPLADNSETDTYVYEITVLTGGFPQE